ncbi:hypothetical protein [Priestia aryabhattai]|uniref:hypothetical protein n=1 Tax=Priestia aryabhattai TaxID=412384 RepID=UPI0030EEA4FF
MPESLDINEQDRLSLIKELEEIKQKLNHYETVVQPLAERELNRIREEQVKAFRLDEAQQAVMAERLADINSEEAIISTAKEVAVALKVEERGQGADTMHYKPMSAHELKVREEAALWGALQAIKGRNISNQAYEKGRANTKRVLDEQKNGVRHLNPRGGSEGVGGVRSGGITGVSQPKPQESALAQANLYKLPVRLVSWFKK